MIAALAPGTFMDVLSPAEPEAIIAVPRRLHEEVSA